MHDQKKSPNTRDEVTITDSSFLYSEKTHKFSSTSSSSTGTTYLVSNLSIEALLSCGCLLETRDPLTQSEFEVASEFVRGFSYGEIARRRSVSMETVKSQITSVRSKTHTRNRFELLLQVLESNVRVLQSLSTEK